MKIVLVTGIEEVEKGPIIDLAIKRSVNRLPNFSVIDYEEKINRLKPMLGDSIDETRKALKGLYNELEAEVVKNMKNETGHLIIITQISLKTINGYISMVSEEFFKVFSPDVIILMEMNTAGMSDAGFIKDVKERQEMNKEYATNLSLFSEAFLKIVSVDKVSVMKTVKEVLGAIKTIL